MTVCRSFCPLGLRRLLDLRKLFVLLLRLNRTVKNDTVLKAALFALEPSTPSSIQQNVTRTMMAQTEWLYSCFRGLRSHYVGSLASSGKVRVFRVFAMQFYHLVESVILLHSGSGCERQTSSKAQTLPGHVLGEILLAQKTARLS